MSTREEEAGQWREVCRSSRKAAQNLLITECYRSAISRAYYTVYAAITSVLVQQNITLGSDGNNPGHAGLPTLVLNNLTVLPLPARFEINKALRRLYAARTEADYQPAATVSGAAALNSLRDLNRVIALLAIKELE